MKVLLLIIVQRDATMNSLFIFCKVTVHVSGVVHTHHQEYIKLTTASGTGHIGVATAFQSGQLGHVGI